MTGSQLQAKVSAAIERRERRKAELLVEEIVRLLNRGSLSGLNELVETWIAADYRLDRWGRREVFECQLSYRVLVLEQESGPVRFSVKWSHFERAARILEKIIHTGDRESKAEAMKALLVGPPPKAKDYIGALELFSGLITGPYYNKIRRCPRCQRFYQKGRLDQTFCSQRCASATTAEKAVHERRHREHQAKLAKVQHAFDKFSKLSSERKVGARDWIAARTGFERNFVTRALRELGKAQ